ncbi:hypothetical protein [Nocardia flavorosea]|uniref:Uncharacterized protein n=1 Tax=Nocardia flavorosea TaxID=53429 RepID=A0A846YDL4_9NOCA|nr:hypothetical protein [Nocardia flavorosea]NKY54889.1 hypothetical protein [Nocardia flavorosea]
MSTRDTIAQLNQDITTAENAGDEATAARLRRELETALRDAKDPKGSTDTE